MLGTTSDMNSTITRLHITSFVAITITAWLAVLWLDGFKLSLALLAPIGTVVGFVALLGTLFNKYFWSWPLLKGWYVKRPDLRGTWRVELKSSWIDPSTGLGIAPIYGFVVVRQTLTSLSFRLMTKESRSTLIAYSIGEQENDDLYKLVAVYRNEPKIELRGKRSEIHHGSLALDIHGSPVSSLEGHYWTDRGTKGGMRMFERNKVLIDTFEQGTNCFGQPT
jgi:hypothetical protein